MQQALQSDGEQKPVVERVAQEVREKANKQTIDIDMETGEVIDVEGVEVQSELVQPGF